MIDEMLAQSAHFTITHEYEVVWLKRPRKRRIIIGDFYGDPTGAIIDSQERWCLMFGAGIILYYLRPPFQQYHYHQTTDQWLEFHRDRENLWFIENAWQVQPDLVQFTTDPVSEYAGTYHLELTRGEIIQI